MKKILLSTMLAGLLSTSLVAATNQVKTTQTNSIKAPSCTKPSNDYGDVLCKSRPLHITVVGQGVAPYNGTYSPAQSYALAKRAAIADSYRLIAEKIKGVYVEGEDLIKNMMVKKSMVRTSVSAMVRNATIVETTIKDGLCEVEMDIIISHAQFVR